MDNRLIDNEITTQEIETPFTGMVIERSPQRQEIDDLISNAAVYGKDANPQYDQVGLLPGITIEERRDYQKDHPEYRCAQYVFGVKKNELWCSPDRNDLSLDFWDNTVNFLGSRGYQIVDGAQDGDIITYRRKKTGDIDPTVLHLGIYDRGKVISKFNSGHIFRHDVNRVPNAYGEEIVVFRKTES